MYIVSHTQSVDILNGLLHKLVYRGLYMCIMVHASIYMRSMNQHIHTHTFFSLMGKYIQDCQGFSNKLSLTFTVKGRRRPASHCKAGENRRSFPGLKVRKNLTCSVCSTRLTRLVWQSLQLIHCWGFDKETANQKMLGVCVFLAWCCHVAWAKMINVNKICLSLNHVGFCQDR